MLKSAWTSNVTTGTVLLWVNEVPSSLFVSVASEERFPSSMMLQMLYLDDCIRPLLLKQSNTVTALTENISNWPRAIDILLSHRALNFLTMKDVKRIRNLFWSRETLYDLQDSKTTLGINCFETLELAEKMVKGVYSLPLSE